MDVKLHPSSTLQTVDENAHATPSSAEARIPTYQALSYALPNDEYEHSRLEDQAFGLLEMMHGQIAHAPIPSAAHIVDIGCGTGIHTRLLGATFPKAQVYGIDLSPVPAQKTTTPANVQFLQGDIMTLVSSHDVHLQFGSVDYAFSRLLVAGMTNWQEYIDDVAALLRPGGWAEMQDFDWDWFSTEQEGDGSKVERDCSKEWKWLQAVKEEANETGWDLDCGSHIASRMEKAGLVDVRQIKYRVPNGEWAMKEKPETERIMRHHVREYPALFHHAIARMLEGVRSEQSIRDFQTECAATLGHSGESLYMPYTVTVGRKP